MSVDSKIRKAQKLAKTGDRAGAVALLKQVLATSPGNRTAQRGLAALTRAAAPDTPPARTAPGAPPSRPHPAPRALKGVEALLKRGDTARAIAEAQRLAMLFPASAPVFNLLGIALTQTGRRDAAVKAFTRVAELSPTHAGAQFNKANALLGTGAFAAAAEAAAEALKLQPKLFEAARLRGFALVQLRQFGAAETAFRKAIRIAPNAPHGHLGLGNVLAATRRPAEALTAYETARDLDPSDPEAYNNIGATLVALNRLDEAVDRLERAVEAHPKHLSMRSNLAKALSDTEQPGKALEQIDAAFELGADQAQLHALKATCLRDLGDIDAAKAAWRRAAELEPDNLEVLAARWKIETIPLDHPDLAKLQQAVDNPALPVKERAKMAFTLFAAHDAADQIDTAVTYLDLGNALRREAAPYDIDANARVLDGLTAGFRGTAPMLSPGDISDTPASCRIVFIVGMPRSGTSLVEQILASHSQVFGAGELHLLHNAMAGIGWKSVETGAGPERDALQNVRRSYLDGIAKLGADAPVVTDKMPLNFRYVGHALAALPEARVLYLRRDARAVCWSNWARRFQGRGNDFGNDMNDLARMYRLHEEAMEVYRAAYPDRIVDVPYERLTEHQEAESRKLVAAAGLDWEPACLDFHETARAVRTASATQVRQKMYTGSSEAWRRYEAHLAPLLAALDQRG